MSACPTINSCRSLVWFTHADFTEDEPKPEQLAVRFKTAEICNDFLRVFNQTRVSGGSWDAVLVVGWQSSEVYC